jgi:uncharacterized protein (DUF1800 family)
MNRRSLLSYSPPNVSDNIVSPIKSPARVLSGLNEFSGTFDYSQLSHLVRRATFGLTYTELKNLSKNNLKDILKTLLTPSADPAPPVFPSTGVSWTDKSYDSNNNSAYVRQMKSWFLSNMLKSGLNIHEKMTLFWHNTLVTEADTVQDARYIYIYYSHLRKFALGNVKEMIKGITTDVAMLRYLNGNTNINGKPNENYARELQELFTIGKGKEIAPGNYTNYTEDDIKAAARVLTGWKDNATTLKTTYDSAKHDSKDKIFSSAYQNYVLKGRTGTNSGVDEMNDLIEMIFRQPETAKNYCRKLYRWFVYYEIDETTEKNVIEPLADILRNNNYEILPVLNALFLSEHFYDSANKWVMIKHPIDFICTSIKQFEVKLPDEKTDGVNYYTFLDKLVTSGALVEMNLLDPPSVAGWVAYYQTPDFYQLWINTSTMPNRNGFTDALIYGSKYYGSPFTWETIDYVKKYVSIPSDGATLVKDLSNILFDKQMSDKQLTYLGETILMQGSPLYEWNGIWQTYINNQTNTNAKNAVKNRLNTLLRFMLRMAEYQLS